MINFLIILLVGIIAALFLLALLFLLAFKDTSPKGIQYKILKNGLGQYYVKFNTGYRKWLRCGSGKHYFLDSSFSMADTFSSYEKAEESAQDYIKQVSLTVVK